MHDQHLAADLGGADLDQPVGRREGDGVVDEIVDQPRQPRFVAGDDRRLRRAGGRRRAGPSSSPRPSQSGSRDSISRPRSTGSKRARDSSASSREASAMSTTSRSSRADVLADDVEQLPPQRRIVDPVERVDRGAQRGERVLELVGDVGGEGLGRVDPLAQRSGSCRAGRGRAGRSRRAGRAAAGTSTSRARPSRTRCGGAGQPAQRSGDGPGEEEREQDREHHRPEQDDRQGEALVADHAPDVARVDGEQQHLSAAPATGAAALI